MNLPVLKAGLAIVSLNYDNISLIKAIVEILKHNITKKKSDNSK